MSKRTQDMNQVSFLFTRDIYRQKYIYINLYEFIICFTGERILEDKI